MKNTITALLAALLLIAPHSCRAQQPEDEIPGSTLWMTLWGKEKKTAQYIQLKQDGTLVCRNEAKKAALTRRGTIDGRLAAKFFAELAESGLLEDTPSTARFENFDTQELLDVSAYRYGELRHTLIPIHFLDKAFKETLAKVKKAADGLPSWNGPYLFMTAIPLSKEDVENEELFQGRIIRFTTMQTADLESFPILVTALYRPRLFIELQEKQDGDALLAFIKTANIKNFGDYFYLATDRGRFKIQILQPNK